MIGVLNMVDRGKVEKTRSAFDDGPYSAALAIQLFNSKENIKFQ